MVNDLGKDKKSGFFITVEGSEGSGKTTSLNFIRGWLQKKQIDFIVTREPGGTPLAENIREMLLHSHDEMIPSSTELLLIFAARAQHLHHVILPALKQGKVVVCDRFTDTTWAYQGGGRQMKKEWIAQLESMVQGELRPDMTLFLDVPVALGLRRAGERGKPDRFEKEREVFFERVRSVYLERAGEYPSQYRIIDASENIEKVNHALGQVLAVSLKQMINVQAAAL